MLIVARSCDQQVIAVDPGAQFLRIRKLQKALLVGRMTTPVEEARAASDARQFSVIEVEIVRTVIALTIVQAHPRFQSCRCQLIDRQTVAAVLRGKLCRNGGLVAQRDLNPLPAERCRDRREQATLVPDIVAKRRRGVEELVLPASIALK